MKTETPSNTNVKYLPTRKAETLIKNETGERMQFSHAVTVLGKNGRQDIIIIDSKLPKKIQAVYLEHETVQLLTIRDWLRTRQQVEAILPMAHGNGLRAGIELAKELDVLDQYLKIRGDHIDPTQY